MALNHRLPPLRRLALLALALLAASGCVQAPDEPLRVGINPWPGYDFLYLAQQKGFLAEEGVDVEIVAFTSVGDSRRAFERGQLDAFGGTTVELLQARTNSDRRPQAFCVTNWSEGADQLLARPEIGSVPDLAGKRVAVEPASVDLLVLNLALEQAGLAPDAVQRVGLGQAEMAEAMAAGEVQAAVTYPPASVHIRNESGARALFDTADAPRAVLDLFIGAQDALRQRPADFAALVRAFDRAVHYAEKHPEESHRIMANREGITPEELRRSLARIRVMDLAAQRDMWPEEVAAAVEMTARTLSDAGQMAAAPEAARLIDPTPVQRAAGE
jgi:NitT/TauT family transport system substrate-binding protein